MRLEVEIGVASDKDLVMINVWNGLEQAMFCSRIANGVIIMFFSYLLKLKSAWRENISHYTFTIDKNIKVGEDEWKLKKNVDYMKYLKFEFLNVGLFAQNISVGSLYGLS